MLMLAGCGSDVAEDASDDVAEETTDSIDEVTDDSETGDTVEEIVEVVPEDDISDEDVVEFEDVF